MIKTIEDIRREGLKENEIYQADCLETMKLMKDKSVDLILTDPPYNAKIIGPNARIYAEGQMQLPEKEYRKFCHDWFKEAVRVGKRLVFTPGIANMCFYPQPKWAICWHKPAAASFNRMGGFNVWEPIMVYGKIPKGKKLGQDYILCNTLNFTNGPETDHPCPKPLELVKFLVGKFSLEGEMILDPMAGSGTTLVAAKHLKRNYIGIEIVKEYCEISRKRLRQELLL